MLSKVVVKRQRCFPIWLYRTYRFATMILGDCWFKGQYLKDVHTEGEGVKKFCL